MGIKETTTPEVEGIEEIGILNKLRESFGSLWQKDTEGNPTYEVTVEVASVLHHQLQKARQDIHTSLVVAVEGLKKQAPYTYDDDMCQALDNTLTIINSIFKE